MDGCKYLTCFNLCDLFIILFQLHFVVSCHQSKISEIEKILKLDIKIPEIVYKKAEAASEPEAPVHNPLDDSKPSEEEGVYHSVTPSGISRGKQLPMLSMSPTDFESMTLDDIKDEEGVTSVPKYAETKAQEEHEEDDNEDEDNEDEDNDSDDSSSDSDSNDESSSSDSSDSSDSEVDQKDEPPTQEDKEDDNYWGLPDLSSDDEDNDDDCIPTFPSHLLQELENNEKRSSEAEDDSDEMEQASASVRDQIAHDHEIVDSVSEDNLEVDEKNDATSENIGFPVTVKEEVDTRLEMLLYSTLNNIDEVKKETENVVKVKEEPAIEQEAARNEEEYNKTEILTSEEEPVNDNSCQQNAKMIKLDDCPCITDELDILEVEFEILHIV